MDEEDKPRPKLRIVASNSTKAVNKEREFWHVARFLPDLAAAIMRVARGTGRPQEIPHYTIELAKAFEEYQRKCGELPAGKRITEALLVCEDRDLSQFSAEEQLRVRVKERVIKAALQIAASRSRRNLTQETLASDELWSALNDYADFWMARRKKRGY